MATTHQERRVWVAVYVEKPKRKSFLSNNHRQPHHRHHHHHRHLHLHQAKNACHNRGYNRRAHLLEYSRQLRESARSQQSSPLLPVYHHRSQQPPMTQILPVQKKRIHSVTPTFLRKWKLLIPGFIRALFRSRHEKGKKSMKYSSPEATTTKIKAIVKSFQVKKKGGFTTKMFASRRKYQ